MPSDTNDTKALSKKRQNTAQRIIKALGEEAGLLTTAAKKAGVSYATIKRYATEFQSVKDAVQEAKESMLDYTEDKLFQNIQMGKEASIFFYLKTQGKHRGYIERQEVTGQDGKALIERAPTVIKLEDGGVFIPPQLTANGYDPKLIAEN